MKLTVRGVVQFGLRVFLGGLFLAAGLSKVGATMQTLAAVYSYQITLPDWVANAVAAGLPWVEILIGAGLLIGLGLRFFLPLAALVLGVFTFLTAQAWWRELPIDCGCFDFSVLHPALAVLGTPGGATLRNLVLLAIVGVLEWMRRQTLRAS